MLTPVPCPPGIPFIGNAASIDSELPLNSFRLFAQRYGDIYMLKMLGRKGYMINSQSLLDEVSNDKRFRKYIHTPIAEVRTATGDALFTAHVPGEDNWFIAHRILLPAFSAINVHDMFDDMMDIISQLILKWERYGSGNRINPAIDFSSLTLDAISLCAMSYRLNSFYLDKMHPFIQAMSDFLSESGRRAYRPGIVNSLMWGSSAKYEEDQRIMMRYVDEILEDRKVNPTRKKDILDMMLDGVDKETGQKLSEDCIKKNLLIFLVAGHETTSGMLSFAVYYLLKNPESMRKLREEVDTIIGQRVLTVNDMHKLPYLIAVMRETLRLAPTAPYRAVSAFEDTVIGGKYATEQGVSIGCDIYMCHRDPKVWGEDAEQFRPERMMDGKFEALPPNAWQPFGFGMRACIGRPFAWQEVQMTLIAIMQRFDLVMEDPSYELSLKQTLSIKPRDFYIRAIPRAQASRLFALPSSALFRARDGIRGDGADQKPIIASPQGANQPLYVLYGSNTGCCEAFARRIAFGAAKHGFRASIGILDSAIEHVPTDGPVVIITASYEGQPADNAAHFVSWLSSLKTDELTGTKFALFGCGNRDWVATYQRVPTMCDRLFVERGATRLTDRGEGDASSGNFFEAFDRWEATLWEALQKSYSTTEVSGFGLEVEPIGNGTERALTLCQADTTFGIVVENKVLTSPGAPVKIHLEFDLPEGAEYRAGDYLAILPVNPARDVQRVLARFNLTPHQEVKLTAAGPSSLPTGKPISVFSLLSGYVELSQRATTRDLRTILEAAKSDDTRTELNNFLDSYSEQVMAKRISVLDILEEYKDIDLPFGQFLLMLPSMRVRQYSISSSPLFNPKRVTLTLRVLDAPAMSGRKDPFLGVASTYLSGLRPGDKVQIAVRPSSAAFHPPQDPEVPMVMFCAGSGLAPMRGFLQERAVQKKSGRDVAKTLLFFGCRSPTEDYLYSQSDLKEWEEMGIVDIKTAFSRASELSAGCRYVQDRVWLDRAEVNAAYLAGGKFFVCGSGKIAAGVKEKLVAMFQESADLDESAAAARLAEDTLEGRFATDVFE